MRIPACYFRTITTSHSGLTHSSTGELDVEQYLNGNSKCWVTPEEKNQVRKKLILDLFWFLIHSWSLSLSHFSNFLVQLIVGQVAVRHKKRIFVLLFDRFFHLLVITALLRVIYAFALGLTLPFVVGIDFVVKEFLCLRLKKNMF